MNDKIMALAKKSFNFRPDQNFSSLEELLYFARKNYKWQLYQDISSGLLEQIAPIIDKVGSPVDPL